MPIPTQPLLQRKNHVMQIALVNAFEIRQGKREEFGDAIHEMIELFAANNLPEPRVWQGFIAGSETGKVFLVIEFDGMQALTDFYAKAETIEEYGAWARREHGADGSMKLLGRYVLDEHFK
jgi:hypothetical protein